MSFVFHTAGSAPEGSKEILNGARKKMGFVPNLCAGLAESPEILNAYVAISETFKNTSLTAQEQQVVLLAVSVENGCEFCVGAHSVMARNMARVPGDVVDALRANTELPDTRLNALAEFTRAVVRERGFVQGEKLAAFLAAGFTRAQVLEVILGVGMKTISNYANHLLESPLNEQFSSEEWQRAA